MKLSQGEQSVLAYFPDRISAQEAMQALREMGIKELQLDRVSRYGVNNDAQYNNPISGQAETQTGLTLYSADTDHFNNNDARVLLGADPSVEGYAPPGYGQAGGKAFLVTVVAGYEQVDRAAALLKDRGAYF